jgi:hypothetical protein
MRSTRATIALFLCEVLSAQSHIPPIGVGKAKASAGATVSYDNSNSAGTGGGTSISFSLVIGSGSNRGIIVGCSWAAQVSSIAVTVGGVTTPAITGTNSGAAEAYMVAMFALAAPASGSQTVAISWTTSTVAVCGAVSADGVDQTTPSNNGTFAHAASGVPTVSVTSSAGDLTVAVLSLESGASASGSTQTERWNVRQSFTIGTAGSTGTGAAGPITHAWDTTGSAWQVAGANFKHA